MTSHLIASPAALAAFVALPACSSPLVEQASDPAAKSETTKGLAIETVAAREINNIPLSSVPGTIVLPPEARVAVTAPCPGAAVRVYVIEGQGVSRGEALALVRASEPVQNRGDLGRKRSASALADARQSLAQSSGLAMPARTRPEAQFPALAVPVDAPGVPLLQMAAIENLEPVQQLGEIDLADLMLGEQLAHAAFRIEGEARAEAMRAITKSRIDVHDLWLGD